MPYTTPTHSSPTTDNPDSTSEFSHHETIGLKLRQQDTIAWDTLPHKLFESLTPSQIAERLWTSYRLLDKHPFPSETGATACTTVYDGKGSLITATLGDAVSFIAIFDRIGKPLRVKRLNSVIHTTKNPDERRRIVQAGGVIYAYKGSLRVEGLNVTRAIGDHFAKQFILSEATLDITSITDLLSEYASNSIGKILIINTCDGFTEPVSNTSDDVRTQQEEYLLAALQASQTFNPTASPLAQHLVDYAFKKGSRDNISVAIQPITAKTPPCFLGVYDGHGYQGEQTSEDIAMSISDVFKAQCQLTPEDYDQQPLSASSSQVLYERDNRDLAKRSTRLDLPSNPAIDTLDLGDMQVSPMTPREQLGMFNPPPPAATTTHLDPHGQPAYNPVS